MIENLGRPSANAVYRRVDEQQKEALVLGDAYPFLIPLLLLGAALVLLGRSGAVSGSLSGLSSWAGAAAWLLALFVAFFFRNPRREVPGDPRLVLSPADGRVVVVRPLRPEEAPGGTLVSIFLSIFDVHVNRTPVGGVIKSIEYRRGRFMAAGGERSSVENEQNVVTVANDMVEVSFKQIAGLIARRIVFWHRLGDRLEPGARVGLIKFGSRTDLILPPGVSVGVREGDRVKGGVSIIGKVKA